MNNFILQNYVIILITFILFKESVVIFCCTKGELHKLIMQQSEMTIDYAYKFHDKTINKIHIHSNQPNLLISGSQDGKVKLIDFHNKKVIEEFKHDSDDKVTDVMFNPSQSMLHQFASGSENGSVYVRFFILIF
jgi:WD40 repeat protein